LDLPALRTAGDPHDVAKALQDALLDTLRLAVVVVRLNDPHGGPSIETMRHAQTSVDAAGAECAFACTRLGVEGELGIVVAGSHRLDFPTATETLLLERAAARATIVLQQALAAAERTRAAAVLRESGCELRSILDSLPAGFALMARDGAVETVNQQLVDYFGKTLDELKRWMSSDAVHPDDRARVAKRFTHSIATGDRYDNEQRHLRFDGVYRWFRVLGVPLRDADGRIVRWSVLHIDIDERKRAEEARRESERESRLVMENIPGLVATLTPTGDVDFVNDRLVEYCGQPLEAMRQWGTNGTVLPDDLPRIGPVFSQAIAAGQPYDFEARIRRFDGVYRWHDVRGLPLRDTTGRIVRWYVLLSDIDERERAEQELQRSEAFLAQAQRLTLTGSLWWDVATGHMIWSDETFRLVDVPMTLTPTLELALSRVHPDDRAVVRELVERSARDGVNLDLEHRLLMPDGSVKHIHVVLQNVGREPGKPEFVGAVTDITDRKRAEAELRRAYDHLTEAHRVTTFSALTASIAHEVNQPLSGIITNAGTCLRMLDATPPDIDGARETARRTIRDGNRASDVIARLRALFSRREFTLEPLDLNEATREVIALSSNDLQRQRIVLRSELADGLPTVTGDRIQLEQVILNLLRNASDAMADVHDRPRQLLIRTERDADDRVRLTVRDTGVGLGSPSMDLLFDAFYTTKSGGMGIGLFVSRSIIERHQGRLWAEPNNGPGATFAFSIPLNPTTMTDAHTPRTA
jgi:PAS domain S-box-containing protein